MCPDWRDHLMTVLSSMMLSNIDNNDSFFIINIYKSSFNFISIGKLKFINNLQSNRIKKILKSLCK